MKMGRTRTQVFPDGDDFRELRRGRLLVLRARVLGRTIGGGSRHAMVTGVISS